MKYLLLLLFIPVTLFSQTSKNTIHYEGGVLTDELIQHYLSDSQKVIHNKVLGVDVKISIDTVFKKYSILFTDKDGQRKLMMFEYVRDYYPTVKNDFPSWNKLYLMEFQGIRYFLIDYLETDPFYELEVRHNEMFPNNCTLLYRVKKAKKHL